MRTLMLVPILALSLPMQAEQTQPESEAAETPGPRCLQISRIRQTKVVDDKTIIFQMRGGVDYENRMANRCPGLRAYRSFGYAPTANNVCDLDTITVFENGRRGATCGLGKFVEYVPPEEEKQEGEAEAKSEG